jgi:hypothetical protein
LSPLSAYASTLPITLMYAEPSSVSIVSCVQTGRNEVVVGELVKNDVEVQLIERKVVVGVLVLRDVRGALCAHCRRLVQSPSDSVTIRSTNSQ